ncbi:MAG: DciA family protein [Neomegalonema sp.]|nr:DciA family protein [Neomegalonema sp.]
MASARPFDPFERRSRGFAAAGSHVKVQVRDVASRRGIAEVRLITHWSEIVGPQLAAVTRPLRVKQPRGQSLGGILVMAVETAYASEVEHQKPMIIERVNAYYGYRAVSEIKVTQAIAPLPPASPVNAAPRQIVSPNDLPNPDRQRLDVMTAPIADDGLRDALNRLGANVISKANKKKLSQ